MENNKEGKESAEQLEDSQEDMVSCKSSEENVSGSGEWLCQLLLKAEYGSECSEMLSDFPNSGFERWVVETECFTIDWA